MMNDYKELVVQLDGACFFKMADGDISKADLFARAADAIYRLVKERDELTTKCCRLEQERDAAVAAVHKQCSTCKRVDFCATDAGQPTLWACVSAAKCNWEWHGVQEDNDEID